MKKVNKSEIFTMIKGACVMASGGGGSYLVANEIIEQGVKDDAVVVIVEGNDMEAGDWIAASANIGSPNALFKTANPYAATNAFNALSTQCRYAAGHDPYFRTFQAFKHVLPAELGAINTATPLAVAAQLNLTIINGDGAGRAIPELQLTTFVGNIPMGPVVNASEAPPGAPYNSSILHVSDEIAAEAAIIGLVMTPPFEGIAGLALYAVTQDKLGNIPVWGGLFDAFEIGTIYEQSSGQERLDGILDYLNNVRVPARQAELLLHGKVVEISQSAGGVDIGYIVVADIEDSSRRLWIYNENENLYAQFEGQDQPVILPPDSICYIPASKDQVPFDNSDLNNLMVQQPQVNPELYIVKIKADSKMESKTISANFQAILRKRGYAGSLH